MRTLRAKILSVCGDEIDPGDLDLILERLCRKPGSGRVFFIRPRERGGYGF